MGISRSCNTKKLLEIIDIYFGKNKKDSKFAEINLLERNISGEELIDILNELEKTNKNKIKEETNRIEELHRDYENLQLGYDKLNDDCAQLGLYIEKYKPLIECISSILEKTARDEVRRLMKNKKNEHSDDLPF